MLDNMHQQCAMMMCTVQVKMDRGIKYVAIASLSIKCHTHQASREIRISQTERIATAMQQHRWARVYNSNGDVDSSNADDLAEVP